MENVRVRFAPSPTGPLHIGGLRTALYNYLFAKNNGGSFVLRIEDTDRTRYVPGAEDYIFESMSWIGIEPDESTRNGGDYAPYRQSERKSQYTEYANRLVESGKAYYAFDTPEEIEAMRERLTAEKNPNPTYNSTTRKSMNNSLNLQKDEVLDMLRNNVPHVVRLKVPENEFVSFTDLIRGEVKVSTNEIDDKILLKSDGMPTYHLANVVDDHLMKISHVIRGEEWLPSAPLHILLYQFLGWEDSIPRFAHLPLLLKPDGNGKLSKRDGIKHGYPVFPLEWTDRDSDQKLKGFREEGFLPEACINFLALLGWNPGTEQEIFSLDELISEFSIERVNKAGAKFDLKKATWFNEHYLREQPTQNLLLYLKDSLYKEGITYDDETKLTEIVEMMRERISFPADIYNNAPYFFKRPDSYDEKVVRKKWTTQNVDILGKYSQAIAEIPEEEFNDASAREALVTLTESNNVGMGQVMQPLRVAVTGQPGGPDIMKILEVLGKKEVCERINLALETLHEQVKEKK